MINWVLLFLDYNHDHCNVCRFYLLPSICPLQTGPDCRRFCIYILLPFHKTCCRVPRRPNCSNSHVYSLGFPLVKILFLAPTGALGSQISVCPSHAKLSKAHFLHLSDTRAYRSIVEHNIAHQSTQVHAHQAFSSKRVGSSEGQLIRDHAHQGAYSSESVLIKEGAHQRVSSAESVLIRECTHQRECSSESLLIRKCA